MALFTTVSITLLIFFLSTIHLTVSQSPETAIISPGVPWYDTDGNRLYAGGANIYQENGIYYLIGEGNKTYSSAACSSCFNLYSSSDLQHWKFEGCVLNNTDIRQAAPPPFNNATAYPFYRMERPKLFKCPATQKYIIWFHCDTDNFAMTSVGVLISDSVTGPFQFAGQCFKPDGFDSYDMGIFYDDPKFPNGDGHVYLVRSVENSYAGISQLSEDCLSLSTMGIISAVEMKVEAQAIMRDSNGTLMMASSHESGWGPNPAVFVTSPNSSLVNATWEINLEYNPSQNGQTYESQSSFLFPYEHPDGHITHIWMADRWNMWGPGSIENMTLIWLPFRPPIGPVPSQAQPDWVVQLNVCNETDSLQIFQWNDNNTVTHTASGLCVTQPPNANSSTYLYIEECNGSNEQTWYRTGAAISNTSTGLRDNCVNWNCGYGDNLGAQVILYRCGNETQWNSRFDFPLNSNTPGLFQSLSDASPTDYCLSVAPMINPSLWYLPWYDNWSLGDF